MQVTMTVNGDEVTRDVEPRLLLVHFLRDDARADRHPLGLRHHQLRHLRRADGRRAGQVVHRARRDGRRPRGPHRRGPRAATATLDPVQQGFMEEHGLQCGFCTPGHDAHRPRAARPQPATRPTSEIREAISGQICRCTGYATIVRSVQWAAEHPAPRRRPRRRRRMTDRRASPRGQPAPSATTGRSASAGCSARRTRASSAARAATSTTSSCPGCCTARSCARPLAHARIVSIDTTAALAHPKVHAVITGATSPALGLAWMPTLSGRHAGGAGHRQGALPGPGGRVRRRRGPLRRARRARADRRRVRAAAGRWSTRGTALDAGRAGHPRRPRGQDRQPHLRLGGRRRGRDRRGRSPRADVVVDAGHASTRACTRRRWRPAARSPTTTASTASSRCGATTQAPHAHRTLYALVAGLPEHKIRVISPRHRRRLRQQGRRSTPATSARSSARSSPASR